MTRKVGQGLGGYFLLKRIKQAKDLYPGRAGKLMIAEGLVICILIVTVIFRLWLEVRVVVEKRKNRQVVEKSTTILTPEEIRAEALALFEKQGYLDGGNKEIFLKLAEDLYQKVLKNRAKQQKAKSGKTGTSRWHP